MQTSMVPPPEALPQALPTARLSAAGRLSPELRAELRRIPAWRNSLSVLGAWAQSLGPLSLAVWIDRPWAFALGFLAAGRGFALLNILGHEAAHKLLFPSKRLNDLVGRWGLAYPAFTPFEVYRRAHMAHHRDELGPEEPDLNLYSGYPVSPASFARKLARDALGVSGYKNLKPLLRSALKRSSAGLAWRILGTQMVLWAAMWALSGLWWLYPLLWLAPWMTVWRVLNRLRAVAEHAGMVASSDRRLTTHVVRQRPLARFWIVPYNTGWHLAHHVDMGIPFRNLPRFHAELVASGWLNEHLEYPSYVALWKALASLERHRPWEAAAAAVQAA